MHPPHPRPWPTTGHPPQATTGAHVPVAACLPSRRTASLKESTTATPATGHRCPRLTLVRLPTLQRWWGGLDCTLCSVHFMQTGTAACVHVSPRWSGVACSSCTSQYRTYSSALKFCLPSPMYTPHACARRGEASTCLATSRKWDEPNRVRECARGVHAWYICVRHPVSILVPRVRGMDMYTTCARRGDRSPAGPGIALDWVVLIVRWVC